MSDETQKSASVFGVPDQDVVIAQIDAVAEDDLTSNFFGDSIADVEGAATRMFDVGVRTLTDDAPPSPEAFGRAPTADGRATEAEADVPPGLPASLHSAAARRAFILGGPAALA